MRMVGFSLDMLLLCKIRRSMNSRQSLQVLFNRLKLILNLLLNGSVDTSAGDLLLQPITVFAKNARNLFLSLGSRQSIHSILNLFNQFAILLEGVKSIQPSLAEL